VEELDWRRQLEQIAGPPRPESDVPFSQVPTARKLKARS
jgi:hypothetical protein